MPDRIKAISLLTVKTLKKKYLEQIKPVEYSVRMYETLIDDLVSDSPTRKICGWVDGNLVGMPNVPRVWIISGPGEGEIRTMIPPDQLGDTRLANKYKDIPQLFVD